MERRKQFLIFVGRNVSRYRTQQYLSLRKFSKLCGIHWSNISRIERGEVSITLKTLAKLAKALKVSAYELLTKEEVGHEQK